MIIIDTDVLIEIFDKKSQKGSLALENIEQSGENIAITSLSLHEIQYAVCKFGKKEIPSVEKLETIDFCKEDALLSVQLELNAEQKGTPLSRIDAMIAAIVINRKAK
ncbi:MAG: type II toxin-antitoxin system VapC family toxin [Thermoplasmatota archaeon]